MSRKEQMPQCQKCRFTQLEVTGPVRPWKDLEKAPVTCLGCGHCWLSENTIIRQRAEVLFPRPIPA